MDSLELTRHLHKNGLLTKEAAIRILKQRDGLIKKAVERHAEELFKTAAGGSAGKVPSRGGRTLFTKSLQNLLPIAGLAGLAALGSAAAKFVATSAADTKLRMEVQKSYGKMFEQYPELKDYKDEATQHFNIIAKFAPTLASNPFVAGTFVKGTMEHGHVGPDTVRSLIEAQRSWEDVRERRSPITGFTTALPPASRMVETAFKIEPTS